MRYIKATFRKVVQVENFEPEEVILEVSPEGSSIADCLKDMKAEATAALGKVVVVSAVAETPVAEVKEVPKKKAPAKKTPAKKVEVEVEVAEVKAEAPVAEVKEEEVKKETPKKKTPAKKAKVDYLNYDRTNDAHKADIAKAFRSVIPKWNTTCKAEGGAISKELHGKPMFSADGEVLPEVITMIEERFAPFK